MKHFTASHYLRLKHLLRWTELMSSSINLQSNMLRADLYYNEHTHTGVCTTGSSNLVAQDLLLPWYCTASPYIAMETQKRWLARGFKWNGSRASGSSQVELTSWASVTQTRGEKTPWKIQPHCKYSTKYNLIVWLNLNIWHMFFKIIEVKLSCWRNQRT